MADREARLQSLREARKRKEAGGDSLLEQQSVGGDENALSLAVSETPSKDVSHAVVDSGLADLARARHATAFVPSTQQSTAALEGFGLAPVSLADLAPRRPDADLKADLERRMQALNEKTTEAIRTLANQRLREEAEAEAEEGSSYYSSEDDE